MVEGLGVDVVEIDRVRGVVDRWGDHFLRKVFTDNEIAYNLARASNNALLAAAFCAETISGFYAGFVDKSMGGSSVSLSQKAEAWRKKAEALRAQALNSSLTPRASSSGARPLNFWMGQHDNHGHYPGMI